MNVLKSTQDKVLAVLQAVTGIVERRHTLPILANVLIRKTREAFSAPQEDSLENYSLVLEVPKRRNVCTYAPLTDLVTPRKQSLVLNLPRTSYFGSKVNGRNAP